MTKLDREKTQKGARFWMLFPVGLLVTSVSGWLYMVSIAVDDPGFSVESDYYKKASAYDEVIAQRAENQRLGWTVSATRFEGSGDAAVLSFVLRDEQGHPLTGLQVSAQAFPTARGKQQHTLTFLDKGNGLYEARISGATRGLWEVRMEARLGRELFTQTLRPELSRTNLGKGASTT